MHDEAVVGGGVGGGGGGGGGLGQTICCGKGFLPHKTKIRFGLVVVLLWSQQTSPAQLATLNAYYKFGMVGVGKAYAPLLTAASADCNLSEKVN